VLLADGGSARVRAITPADAGPLQSFHRALSQETVHYRYFSAVARLAPRMLERFTRVDFARDMVLVAEIADRMVALASYHRLTPDDTAEIAFVVADAHQGRGLGTLLLDELAELAREHGVTRFVADTLPNNREMLRVFADFGFELERDSEHGVVHVRFPTVSTARVHELREQRWHRAEVRSVARLLTPRGILLAGEWSRTWLDSRGFGGAIYTDLRSSPLDVDLALYAGPIEPLPELVSTLAGIGVHALALGWIDGAPAGPARAEFDAELRAALRRNGMRGVGPDSLGLLNTSHGLNLWRVRRAIPPRSGGIAIACDAGGEALFERALEEGIGISSAVSLGRRADLSVNDLLHFWEDDPATRAIALAVTSAGRPEKFVPLAARVSSKKPVLALVGGSEECDAPLRQAGVRLFAEPAKLLAQAATC
jgi:RimJ/RimL family protein N-acetyltransferase